MLIAQQAAGVLKMIKASLSAFVVFALVLCTAANPVPVAGIPIPFIPETPSPDHIVIDTRSLLEAKDVIERIDATSFSSSTPGGFNPHLERKDLERIAPQSFNPHLDKKDDALLEPDTLSGGSPRPSSNIRKLPPPAKPIKAF